MGFSGVNLSGKRSKKERRMRQVLFLMTGLFAGTISGLLGMGGAVIIVPALVFIFGFTQHMAQGTALAVMVPPIGILGAYVYYKAGYTDLRAAAVICVGFLAGGFLGAKVASILPDAVLRKAFGVALLLVSLKLIVG